MATAQDRTARMREHEHICDGCAQIESECLCEIDPAEVLDCGSVYHPGCSKCEDR